MKTKLFYLDTLFDIDETKYIFSGPKWSRIKKKILDLFLLEHFLTLIHRNFLQKCIKIVYTERFYFSR